MAYWGYIPFMKTFLSDRCQPTPNVLEVGLDMGQTFVPLYSYMQKNFSEFSLVGVDIKLRDEFWAILMSMQHDNCEGQSMRIGQGSSLDVLPELIQMKEAEGHEGFDVILLDGDHNYYTVSRELEFCKKLTSRGGIIFVDDYSGRYAEKDLYYSDNESFKDVPFATLREGTEGEKMGVRPAVDEFIANNQNWDIVRSLHFPSSEPVILYRKEELEFPSDEWKRPENKGDAWCIKL